MKQQGEELQVRIGEAEERLRRKGGLSARKGMLEEKVRAAEDAAQMLEEVRAELAKVEALIREGVFAPEFQAEREALEESLSRLRAWKEKRDELLQEERALRVWEAERGRLDEARENLRREEERERTLQNWLQERKRRKDEREEEARKLEEELARRGEVERELEGKKRELEMAKVELDEALQEKAALERDLQRIEERRLEKEQIEKDLRCAQEESSIYQELAEAFGKNGLQAMIIEGVLPEIEEEANRLLSDMTGGRMHVRFRTQKQTLRGEFRETLDIEIADEKGTRDYRLYSGGESFRVDLAIRIALSRLLARRARAPLSVLFVDEGFGTQDAEGLERVVEAINSIQDRFKFILVITHLEELKERFPVRIEVTKRPSGSTAKVVRVW